jgi:ribosomal protein S25
MTEPLMVPYPDGSGSGHAGNDTSRERQERNDATGITSRVQQAVYNWLSDVGAEGVTSAEVTDKYGIGEGMSSSALSHLHRAGRIRRVKMRRKRHEIYVLPEYVNGREESPYRPRLKQARHVRELPESTVLKAMDEAGLSTNAVAYGLIRRFLEKLP